MEYNLKMEYENINREQILNKLESHNVIFISGDWGVGKTHFVEHNLKENLDKEAVLICIDARTFELNADAYQKIINIISKNFIKPIKVWNWFKKFLRKLWNAFISTIGIRNNVETSYITFPVSKTDFSEFTKLIKKTKKQRIVIIIDELDRLLPDTQIKTLNFINNLSMKLKILDTKSQNGNKIIVVGNIVEVEKQIEAKIAVQNSRKYLNKYFDGIFIINDFLNFSLIELIHSILNISNYGFDSLLKVLSWRKMNARLFKRKLEAILQIMSKIENIQVCPKLLELILILEISQSAEYEIFDEKDELINYHTEYFTRIVNNELFIFSKCFDENTVSHFEHEKSNDKLSIQRFFGPSITFNDYDLYVTIKEPNSSKDFRLDYNIQNMRYMNIELFFDDIKNRILRLKES